ncbi:MAG: YceI family protein [bacterium]|nr:YceI family protein [bacterium]
METMTKTVWAVDPTHSEISFKVKHMMISTVRGFFKDFDAKIEASNEDLSDAQFSFSADIASVNTNNEDRDNHLKSDDFFNAEAYPKMTFESTSFDGETITGDLTIRDVTKEISLNADVSGVAVDPYGQTKVGLEISGEINRKDFGLTWSAVTEAGNVVVSDKVKLIADVQFVKQ